jgi:N-acetylmuramoyl-L-alanine amidase
VAKHKFLQGIDYGQRKGTLGISLHMSEGFDGLPGFLAKHKGETRHQWAHRVNGVSCHVAVLSDGEIVQMLGWDRACGNLNPNDRAKEYGYYGGSNLRAVLGDHWPDPNAWTVSAEIAGFRAKGPTDAQVRATIAWGLEMRERFPTIRGATGHHDQSPKGCPGTTPAMKAIFAGIGGHGLFTGAPAPEVVEPLVDFTLAQDEMVGRITVREGGATVVTLDGGKRPVLKAGLTRPALGPARLAIRPGLDHYVMFIGTSEIGFVAATDVTFTPFKATK